MPANNFLSKQKSDEWPTRKSPKYISSVGPTQEKWLPS